MLRACVNVVACAVLAAFSGCMVGPNYKAPSARVPSHWQNLQSTSPLNGDDLAVDDPIAEVDNIIKTISLGYDVCDQQYVYTLTGQQCPWWQEFLDEDLKCLIGMQRARSPRLHELRASVDQAWHQRWVLKRGFFPHFENEARYQTAIPSSSDDGRVHNNILRAEMGWELDLFGGRQRAVEVLHRNLEAQVETYRNGMVFLAAEIGLFYTDLRVAEARIELQKENIEFYEEVVQLTEEKLALGGIAEIDLDESRARLERERAALPDLERARDAAKVELARVVGVYSEELDPLITPKQEIPAPGTEITVPTPADVLPLRPDIRRLERKVAAQVGRVAFEFAEQLYPKFSFNYVWDGSDMVIPILNRHGIGLVANNAKRLIATEIERTKIREEEAILQRELHNYQLGLVTASSEIESAIIDLRIAQKKLRALEKALASNQTAFDRVYDAYRSGLLDVRDIIRIRADLFFTQTELIFARNLMAKGTVRLYKALGGVDIPAVPPKMIKSEYDVTDVSDNNRFLSRLFSLNRDTDDTLRTSRVRARMGQEPWYHVTEDGVLRNGVPNENPFLNRMWNLGEWR